MQAHDSEAITTGINYWVGTMIFSAVCACSRDIILGIASERLGESLRMRLFKSVIEKDVAFFDENRTGDICSRISSDTQAVQDGLTTGFAYFCKSSCVCIGMIVIMFTYSWQLTIYAMLLTIPSLFSMRVFFSIFGKYAMKYQKAKSEMSSVASECIGNIRTVKAFADEMGA
jgi:ATP-binding cassette subfamily B protein